MNNMLLSVVIGDMGGMPYEGRRRTKDYDAVNLLYSANTYTDDTVCTFACAEALLHHLDMAVTLHDRCLDDIYRGFGGRFVQWLLSPTVLPSYHSFGNGSAMRTAASGFMARTQEECVDLATRTAQPTHDHPEGIKGAVATSLAIFHAMQGHDKDFIRQEVLNHYYPRWSQRTYADIQPGFHFDSTSQGTVPAALICFLESRDYVDCLKLAIALGGDADTLAAISDPMAYAFYRQMPNELVENAKAKLPRWMLEVNGEMDVYCNAIWEESR